MMRVKLLLAMAGLALAAPAHASPALPQETIDAIALTLPLCTRGWHVSQGAESRDVTAGSLAPRLRLLSRPSTELDEGAASDLYNVAHALLAPATGVPDWAPDGGPFLTCPARPVEAVALMRYLVGEQPGEVRGPVNAFDWLALAYEKGVAGSADPAEARRYHLLSRMHSPLPRHERWSDGKDTDLLANIERVGLRPFLDALATTGRGGPAHLILAEEALPKDPAKARRLLRTLYAPALIRLVKLEAEGRLPIVADAEDNAFWAEAWRTQVSHTRWAGRLIKGAGLVNRGPIPTATERPGIDRLRGALDRERVSLADATRRPVSVRALIDPSGRAIYTEGCRSTPLAAPPRYVDGAALDASRLYEVTRLPPFPIVRDGGRPIYAWVILPAVHFQRPKADKLVIDFADPQAERCAYSSTAEPM